jgi:hypothetical protein
VPIVMGPPSFLTLSNIVDIDTPTSFTITFNSDQAFIARVTWTALSEAPAPGSAPATGFAIDAAATTNHSILLTIGAGHAGKNYSFVITVDPTDVSGKTLRPYNGVTQLTGARVPPIATPIKFYTFGVLYPPLAGGLPGGGNWSTYSWAQYAPKAALLSFAGVQAALSLRVGPGFVYTVTITGAGTTAFVLHDDTGSGTGPTIYTSPASNSVGTVLVVNQPFVNGLTLVQAATGPAGNVSIA